MVLVAVVAASMSFAAARRNDDLSLARKATAKYSDVAVAFADGFTPASPCVTDPNGSGNMGIHFDHPSRVRDLVLDPEKPDILLYERKSTGELRLVGLEYWIIDIDQNKATDFDRPSMFGVPFDGPMDGHAPGMPIHYDLHVWLYKYNPNGTFAIFNPNVHCD
jgi:hypothetical protein